MVIWLGQQSEVGPSQATDYPPCRQVGWGVCTCPVLAAHTATHTLHWDHDSLYVPSCIRNSLLKIVVLLITVYLQIEKITLCGYHMNSYVLLKCYCHYPDKYHNHDTQGFQGWTEILRWILYIIYGSLQACSNPMESPADDGEGIQCDSLLWVQCRQ